MKTRLKTRLKRPSQATDEIICGTMRPKAPAYIVLDYECKGIWEDPEYVKYFLKVCLNHADRIEIGAIRYEQ